MKKWLALVGVAAIGLTLYSVWRTSAPQRARTADQTSLSLANSSKSGSRVANTVQRDTTQNAPTSTAAAASTSPIAQASPVPPAKVDSLPVELANLSPETALENMRTTVRQYGAMFAGNPVGTNPEITQSLSGANPKHINFLKADGNRVNSQGELVDIWGTPYFFHQISGTEMEIRSAGPDRVMYTSDDLVIR